MRVKSYEERRAAIEKFEDLEREIRSAKSLVSRLRAKARKAELLNEKIYFQRLQKEAEAVLRKLRSNYFDIEDELSRAPYKALEQAFSMINVNHK